MTDNGAIVLNKELYSTLMIFSGLQCLPGIPQKALPTGNSIWFGITPEGNLLKLGGTAKVSRHKWPHYILRKLRPREVKGLAQGDKLR